MRYLSVCSGIEAATCAWHPLGWTPAGFSEIEAFPRALLTHHYPNVPLHGDFTTIKGNEYGAIDLLVGGTPCQSFSIAGLRAGLDDPRGNLMLGFGALAQRTRARWLVWENVPGVLSSNGGRDFGSFLGMLAELGYGFAYRVLDAQYYGVAQRRRRVFVVAYLGDWRRAAAVLFERHSLSGNPAPRREAGQGSAAGTLAGTSPGGGWRIGADEAAAGYLLPIDVCPTLRAGGNRTGGDRPPGTDVDTADSLIPIAFDSRQDCVSSTDVFGALGSSSPQAQAVCIHADAIGRTGEAVTPSADAEGRVRLRNPGMGIIDDGTRYNLMASGKPHAVCVTGDITHTLKAEGFDASEDGTGRGQPIVTAFAQNTRDEVREMAVVGALAAQPGMKQTSYIRQGMAVRRLTPRECERLQGFPDDYTDIPYRKKAAADGPRYKALGNSMAVPVMAWIGRRINAVESFDLEIAA